MRFYLTFILCFLFSVVFSQKRIYERTYGGGYIDKPVYTYYKKNKFYVFGNINIDANYPTSSPSPDFSEQYGRTDYNMVAYDVNGKIIFDHAFGGLKNDLLIKVIPFSNGFYLFGISSSTNEGNKTSILNCNPVDIWIVTVDFEGNKISESSICVPTTFDAISQRATFKTIYDVIQSTSGEFIFYIGIEDNNPQISQRIACFNTDANFKITKRYTLFNANSWDGNITGINIVELSSGRIAFLAKMNFKDNSANSWINVSLVGIYNPNTNKVFKSRFLLNKYGVECSPKNLILSDDRLVVFMEDYPNPSYLGTTDYYNLFFNSDSTKATARKAPPRIDLTFKINDIWVVKLDQYILLPRGESAFGTNGYTSMTCSTPTLDDNRILLGCYTTGGKYLDKTTANIGGYDYWIINYDVPSLSVVSDVSYGGTWDDKLTSISNPSGYLLYTGQSYSGKTGDKSEPCRDFERWSGDYWSLGFCLNPTVSFKMKSDSIKVGELVEFTNTSINASEFKWNFGDGSISYEKDAKHYFNMPGTYKVTLVALNPGGCGDSLKNEIKILPRPVGIDELQEGSSLSVFPNPTNGILHIETDLNSELFIYDNIGRIELMKKIITNDDRSIDVSSLDAGMYLIQVKKNNNSLNAKFIKN